MRSRFLWAVLALLPTLAFGHARFDLRVELAPVQLPGITVELHQDILAPQLVLENHGKQTLEVLDAAGRPFLRIGPKDTQADVAAAAFHLSRISGGAVPPPGTLSKTPRWRTVNPSPSYGWFDPRIAVANLEIPAGIRAAGLERGQAIPLGQWQIPVRLGQDSAQIQGLFLHTPPPKGGVRARLLPLSAAGRDLDVQLAPGRLPALRLANRGQAAVEVLDAQDQAFLRIGPDGSWGNLDRPALRAAASGPLPAGKGWQRLSPNPSYVWLEPRAAYTGKTPARGSAQQLGTWQVPLRMGTQRLAIQGVHDWVPAGPAPGRPRR